MRRRRPDEDELLPLEREDDGAAPDGRLVEVGPRTGRRRDLVLLATVVAVVAGIGLLRDDGSDDRARDAAIATSLPERIGLTRPSTTTTALTAGVPVVTPGDGPLLAGRTGSAVAWVDGGGDVHVLDLDTGDRCEVRLPGPRGGAWIEPGVDDAILQGPPQPQLLTAACELTELPDAAQGQLLASDRPGHLWRVSWSPGEVFIAEIGPDGRPSEPPLTVPGMIGGVRAVDGGLVVDVVGSVSYIEVATGDVRELAKGTVLAARDGHVLTMECEALTCAIVLRDLTGREVARAARQRVAPWSGGALGPDERRALLLVNEDDGPHAQLLDLTSGDRRDLGPTTGGRVAFTHDGRYAVVWGPDGLAAHPVDGGEPTTLQARGAGGESFAVLRRP